MLNKPRLEERSSCRHLTWYAESVRDWIQSRTVQTLGVVLTVRWCGISGLLLVGGMFCGFWLFIKSKNYLLGMLKWNWFGKEIIKWLSKQMEKPEWCHLHKQYSAASWTWSRRLYTGCMKKRFILIVLVSI